MITAAGLLSVDSSGASPAGTLPAGTVNPTKSPSPDFTAAWYIPQPWGHMDFGTVLRPTLQVKDGMFVNRTFTGYGVSFSGDVKPGWFGWPKDYITFSFTYGDGIGRYLSGNKTEFSLVSNYPALAAPASAAAAANVRIRTTVSWGGLTSYQHWWTPTLRSNVAFGILHHDINNLGGSGRVCATQVLAATSTSGNCALNKELVASLVNLIWNPVPFADVGIEYFWGHRVVLSNLKGDVNAIISRFRVNF